MNNYWRMLRVEKRNLRQGQCHPSICHLVNKRPRTTLQTTTEVIPLNWLPSTLMLLKIQFNWTLIKTICKWIIDNWVYNSWTHSNRSETTLSTSHSWRMVLSLDLFHLIGKVFTINSIHCMMTTLDTGQTKAVPPRVPSINTRGVAVTSAHLFRERSSCLIISSIKDSSGVILTWSAIREALRKKRNQRDLLRKPTDSRLTFPEDL